MINEFAWNMDHGDNTPSLMGKVVVIEHISNPIDYVETGRLDKLFDEKNGVLLDSPAGTRGALRRQIQLSPRNSIIGIKFNNSGMKIPGIYYPVFSSHMSLPVKPGEIVWIVRPAAETVYSETPGDPRFASGKTLSETEKKVPLQGDKILDGYWLSRVAQPAYVEDANFTHAPRTTSLAYFYESSTNIDAKTRKIRKPTDALHGPPFNNGIYTDPNSPYNEKILAGKADFEFIDKFSLSNKQTTREPIPAFSSRPGDLVLQGSNNTLICLGEDRPPVEGKDSSVFYPTTDPVTGPRTQAYAGTIDIVSGRSIDAEDFLSDNIESVINDRDQVETEKRMWAKTPERQPAVKVSQGDPNFKEDLSRIYVSMKTDGDKNFGFVDEGNLPNSGNPLLPSDGSPYVIMKSNEVRIFAREDGSIRIIKEGTRVSETDPGDQAVITMQPDGTIMIDGPKIIVGSGNEKGNGQGDQVLIGGSSASEPIVLGNALKGIIEELISQIEIMTVPTGVGPSGPPVNAIAFSGIKRRLNTVLSKVGKTK